jgi:CheY-like chemotaxis protein
MVYGFARQSGGQGQVDLGAGAVAGLAVQVHRAAGTETVLVVEDEAGVRSVAVLFLSRLGYRVLQAADADAGLRALDEAGGAVDLLFTDIVLPGMTGVDLARRARERYPSLAVLYTSGYASGGVLSKLPEGEIRNLISKPYRREDLAQAVRRTLEARGVS